MADELIGPNPDQVGGFFKRYTAGILDSTVGFSEAAQGPDSVNRQEYRIDEQCPGYELGKRQWPDKPSSSIQDHQTQNRFEGEEAWETMGERFK